MLYYYTKKSRFSFLETIDELLLSFSEQWFWLVSNIDVSEKIRKKVDESFWEYKILGFCKPDIAYKYLSQDMNLWLFLPCSVYIYEKNWDIYVWTGLPDDIIWKIVQNKNLEQTDREMSEVIKKIIDSIE